MSALATPTTFAQTHADTVASWTTAVTDIDTQITEVLARREAAEADTSEASDVIEDECHAALRRLKTERREIGVQVTKIIQDFTALAENSGFVVVSSSSSGETKTTEAITTAAAPTKEEKIATKVGVRVDQIVCHKYIHIIFSSSFFKYKVFFCRCVSLHMMFISIYILIWSWRILMLCVDIYSVLLQMFSSFLVFSYLVQKVPILFHQEQI